MYRCTATPPDKATYSLSTACTIWWYSPCRSCQERCDSSAAISCASTPASTNTPPKWARICTGSCADSGRATRAESCPNSPSCSWSSWREDSLSSTSTRRGSPTTGFFHRPTQNHSSFRQKRKRGPRATSCSPSKQPTTAESCNSPLISHPFMQLAIDIASIHLLSFN